MKRTTVMLSDDVDARLRMEARRRGVPVAEVVREAVDRMLTDEEPPRPLAFFGVGVGDGGPDDGSERIDDYVLGAMRRRRSD